MAHTKREKEKLMHRVSRIRGQLNAVEKALEEEQDCSAVLHRLAACRGALNALLAEILEGHIREHVVDPSKAANARQAEATEELIDVVRTYFK